MKRILAIVLALVMVFALFACGKKDADSGSTNNPSSSGSTNKPADSGTTASPAPSGTGNVQDVIAGSDDEVHPSDTATLKIAFNSEPGGLTQVAYPFAATMTAGYIFAECLVDWDSDINGIVPKLATEWEWIDDTTLRMKLREDVTSIAGDPFTASDVLFTLKINSETAALASYYNIFDIENCKAVDDYTVDLALNNPYPFLVTELAHKAYTMAVEKTWNDIGGTDAAYDDPSALTGPYKLVKWDAGQCVYAERREDYWGRMPYYKYMEIWTVTDPTTRTMGVEAGDYDVSFKPAVSAVSGADGKTLKGWFVPAAGRICNFCMNSDKDPLNIKEVRQAIAMAIDYESLLKLCFDGQGVLSDSALFSPFNTEYYTPPTEGKENYIHYDLEAAKAKLVEAGYADGFTINCKYRVSEQQTATQAEMLRNMLEKVGITLELKQMESAAWMADMRLGDFDTTISVGGNPNAKRNFNFVDSVRVTHNAASGNAGTRWMPEGFEDVIDRCLYTVDATERKAAFTELNDILREYVPQVLLYCPYSAELTSADIAHVGLDIMGTIDFCTIYPADYVG